MKNKSTRFLIAVTGILFTMLVIAGVVAKYFIQEPSEEKSEDVSVVASNETGEVFYSEGDEDAAYNYITNLKVLNDMDIPYVGAVTFNDRIDAYLRTADYICNPLTITSADESGTIINLKIAIGDTGDILKATYDIRYDTLDMFISTN